MLKSYRKPVLLTSVLKNFHFQLQGTGTLASEIQCDASFQTDCGNVGTTCDQFGFLPIVEVKFFVSNTDCQTLQNGSNCDVSVNGVVIGSANCSSSFQEDGSDCDGGCLVDLICTSFHDGPNQIPCVNMTEASVSCPGVVDGCQTTVENVTGS